MSISEDSRSRLVPSTASFVLVHPAWFGGWCWLKVAAILRSRGLEAYSPTLTGLGERDHLLGPSIDLARHISDVVKVLEFEDLQGVILVGNSSGGMVITGVAESVPERIAQLVYLDAFVPEDGQSLVSLLPPSDGRQWKIWFRPRGRAGCCAFRGTAGRANSKGVIRRDRGGGHCLDHATAAADAVSAFH